MCKIMKFFDKKSILYALNFFSDDIVVNFFRVPWPGDSEVTSG